jgi:hypothetical protein
VLVPNHQPPTTNHRAILVLGMHRSGTSCVAGLLAAAGAVVPGPMVRNWDNPRGHHEATAAIRLNEEVLAGSGGSWLRPPDAVRWTADQVVTRDMLLATTAGPALIKDPRCLLTLPFWRAARPACLGVVRHPAAVAASLRSWRSMAEAEAWALWLAHNRALAAADDVAVIDFDASGVVAAVAGWATAHGLTADHATLEAAWLPEAVHHRTTELPAGVDPALVAETLAVHAGLVARACNHGAVAAIPDFPWALIAAATTRGDDPSAHAALDSGADPAAVLVALAAPLLRQGRINLVLDLAATAGLPAPLAALITAKARLAQDRPAAALAALAPALATDHPDWEARSLHATVLRRTGDRAGARAAQAALIADAIHPWQEAAHLATWEREDAIAGHRERLAAALRDCPAHRRGRLLCRLARWHLHDGDRAAAAGFLQRCACEDPAWPIPADLAQALSK